jgi:hypothetical protein
MSRKRVDLHRLPIWLQYTIALATAALVILAALTVGRNHPGPAWITDYLIPIWRWVGVAVLFSLILSWVAKKLKA